MKTPPPSPDTVKPDSAGSHERRIFVAVLLIALAIAGIHAYALRYVNDDCFVSFRYAKNIANGLGIVYNAEERVEGYTNFLWTMLLAIGAKFGVDPIVQTYGMGIAAFIATVALYGGVSWKLRDKGRSGLVLPLAALAVAVHRDCAVHATSGMETSLFSLWIAAAYAALVPGTGIRSSLLAGLFFVLAMMTRPDGAVFLAAAGVYTLLFDPHPVRRSLALALPVVFLFLPYWFWRASYFGFFFPNTFYAKSIGLDYYSQGLLYLWLYVKTYPVLLAAIPAAVVVLRGTWRQAPGKSFAARLRIDGAEPRATVLAVLFTAAYVLFIVRIGGDFMFARFFIAVTPLCYLVIERALVRVRRMDVRIGLAAVVLAATVFRFDQFRDAPMVGYVADEKQYFETVEPLDASLRQAAMLKRHFGDLPVRLAFYAGQLRLIYYLDPPMAVESSSGLTDTAIAHQQIETRERVGHEKHPSLEYLIKRRVHFYIGYTEPPPPGQIVLNAIMFDSMVARIITYDNRIMSVLEKDSGVTFIHLPSYLDDYLSRIGTFPKSKVAADYSFLKPFYFDVNGDAARERQFLDYLRK